MQQGNYRNTELSYPALSATTIADAWYLGVKIKTQIYSVKGLSRSLRSKGLTKDQRKEVIRNAL